MLEVDLHPALSPAVPIWLTELPWLSSALIITSHCLAIAGLLVEPIDVTTPALLILVGYCRTVPLLMRLLRLTVLWSPFAPG